jgi:hypothetical protein
MKSLLGLTVFLVCFFVLSGIGVAVQDNSSPVSPAAKPGTSDAPSPTPRLSSVKTLEGDFFTIVRAGDPHKLLDYISDGGVNVGPDAQHMTRQEIEAQLNRHEGIYCKLFDSACIRSQIKLDNSGVRQCSYRDLLTSSTNIRTAATDTTRNGVRQAILIAQVKNDSCAGVGLIDFIFNAQSDGWKLFSIP